MEKEAVSSKKSDSARKRTRRRSHTRKAAMNSSFLNMAEARREVVNALQLHRSSSSSSSSSASVLKMNNIYNPTSQNHNYFHQLTDSIPIPEPTWSTTAPTVLCAPVPSMEVLEIEWFDNLSSSYSWWMGFLSSLDGKNGADATSEELKRPCFDARRKDEKCGLGEDDQNPFTDEWLIFPATDECGEQV